MDHAAENTFMGYLPIIGPPARPEKGKISPTQIDIPGKKKYAFLIRKTLPKKAPDSLIQQPKQT
jgi:hypothetical protein